MSNDERNELMGRALEASKLAADLGLEMLALSELLEPWHYEDVQKRALRMAHNAGEMVRGRLTVEGIRIVRDELRAVRHEHEAWREGVRNELRAARERPEVAGDPRGECDR